MEISSNKTDSITLQSNALQLAYWLVSKCQLILPFLRIRVPTSFQLCDSEYLSMIASSIEMPF